MAIDHIDPTIDKHAQPVAVRLGRGVAIVLGISISTGISAWAVGTAIASVAGNRNQMWLLGRAAGITSYALLLSLVASGLVLSHPWRARWRRPSPATRIRVHVSVAAFTLVFATLHIVVLVQDKYAGVGLRGALLPMAATYRPMAVTLGVIGIYSGLLAGLTALLAGRIAARIWWPIHKVAILALVLVWLHGVLAGSDSPALRWMYYSSSFFILAMAVSRYTARTPADLVAELTSESHKNVRR